MKTKLSVLLILFGAFVLLFSFGKSPSRDSQINKSKALDHTKETGQIYAPSKKLLQTHSNINNEGSLQSAAQRISHFFQEIPRVNSLHNLTEHDTHATPEPVLRAGQFMAEMRDFFIKNPQPVKIELGFYLACSQEKDLFTSVRALCAARASQKYFETTGRKISDSAFDKKIASLREKISL